jgi:dienelactone hydrolase
MRTGFVCNIVLTVAPLAAQPLAGTMELHRQGDLAVQMVNDIGTWLDSRIASSPQRRRAPTAADRQRLRTLIGAVDARVPYEAPIPDGNLAREPKVEDAGTYETLAVRWPVLDGIDAEGLLIRPKAGPRCYAVALPDADQTPEQAGFARRLAESGCVVMVPVLIDRADTHSGNPAIRFTNQPHREFIHRMAYEMGRHIIGYEAQKVMAALDWFAKLPKLPVLVAGYGEGGLIAQFSAAIDPRIDAVLVSGYFQAREQVWREPIYRNIWTQLEQFGDAEIAALVAPRRMIVEASPHPTVIGPPPERQGRRGAASGMISTPDIGAVRSEVERARKYPGVKIDLVEAGPMSEAALKLLLPDLAAPGEPVRPWGPRRDAQARHERQFRQMIDYTQKLMRLSEFRRKEFLAQADVTSVAALASTMEPYRRIFHEEIQGKMPPWKAELRAESRLIYDKPKYRGYEVVIPMWDPVYAYGILLVPKDLKLGERRPVVVTQHGLEGRPQDTIEPGDERTRNVYANFSAALADRGFIVFAPQNPYIGMEKFRLLMRKANPVKLSLFSFIIGQHERILDWLETLPFADRERIGFYGLSYGGKTAMRVPALVTRYALSICSGDFNEWVSKVTSYDYPFSYMFTQEYDMLEFNLGHTFNYAEMALLIAPRPFMVERGHADGVGIDEWVSSEYAKVRRWYAYLGIPERTTIEYFKGPHQIHGVGTYEFLHDKLRWSRPR